MPSKVENRQSGFTLIELIVTMGVFLTIFTLSWLNFSTISSTSSLGISTQSLISDLRDQQTKAMTGYSLNGVSESDYGIYFGSNYYTLFKGSTFNSNDSNNFSVNLADANLKFTNVLFQNNIVVFRASSGEVENYLQGFDSITILNTLTSKTTVIKLNEYGATY